MIRAAAILPLLFLASCGPRGHSAAELMALSDDDLARHWARVTRPGVYDQPVRGDYETPADYRRAVRMEAASRRAAWPREVLADVIAGEVVEGMTMEQVWWSWGEPWRRDRVEQPIATFEAWEYAAGRFTIYFRDGRVHWWRGESRPRR